MTIDDVIARVGAVCERLPEVERRDEAMGAVFHRKRRVVAYVIEYDDVEMVVVNADPDEVRALVAGGHPYFEPNSGANRLGIVIDADTDWDQLGELVEESFWEIAPKRLRPQP